MLRISLTILSKSHMNRLTTQALSTLAETFSLLRNNMPKGWVWNPILVKSSGLKPDSSEDFNVTFYKRADHGMVVFCSGMSDHRLRIKILIAYQSDQKDAMIREAKKMHPEWDMTREGEIRHGVKCLIGVTNIPLPTNQHHHKNHKSQGVHQKALVMSHHGDKPETPPKPQWTKSWRNQEQATVIQAKVWEQPKKKEVAPATPLSTTRAVTKMPSAPVDLTGLRKHLALNTRR